MSQNQPIAKAHLLLASRAANSMLGPLRSCGYDVVVADISRPSSAHVRVLLESVDIVLFDVNASNREVLAIVHDLSAAIGMVDVAPQLLCFSTAHRNAQFVLAIEKSGARYARISDAALLVEAIELLLANMEGLRRNGPCFHILHRFARGGCAPGEECAAAVLLPRAPHPQLRLALSERCVFNVLASHRRVAFDARQIVATLTGDWRYRDYGANAGVVQRIKVRVPAVRVCIDRIRRAIGLKAAEAHLRIDPYDVVESLPTVGSNRVLYRLNAEVLVIHSAD